MVNQRISSDNNFLKEVINLPLSLKLFGHVIIARKVKEPSNFDVYLLDTLI